MALTRRLLIVALLLCGLPMMAQVVNCPSGFVTTNTGCGVGGLIPGSGSAIKVIGTQNGVTPAMSGSNVVIAPAGGVHFALSMLYQTAVNIQAFTTVYKFIPNGQNFAFTINNCAAGSGSGFRSCGGFNLQSFSSGASCEGGFSQAFTGNPFPYNIFALMFDNYGLLTPGGSSFTYSNAQIYQENQLPCNPSSGGVFSAYTNKISTSPVAMNSPSNNQGSTTGDTYSATLNYDGSNLNLCLIDVTVGGSTCNGTGTSGTGTFFQQTWQNVSIPSQVNGNTGYIGFTGSSGEASIGPLTVVGWTYTVNTATASPTSTVTSAGAPTATNPTFSPVAGSYSGTQNVTITSAGSSNICYALGAANLVITPLADQNGGCNTGTLYTGPVAVTSSQTLYATAGLNNTGLSSGVVSGAYTIGTGTAATPTFSPAAGTYTGSQSVTVSTTSSGANIYTNTTGSPTCSSTLYTAPITVAASETLYAVACTGSTTYVTSSVGSAAYTISTGAATPVISLAAGTYAGTQSVTATTSSGGAVMCYRLDGSSPGTNGTTGCAAGSTLYTGAISVAVSETLKIVAGGTTYTDSSAASNAYVITGVSPTFSPIAGNYLPPQAVAISTTFGPVICFNTTGAPATNGASACASGSTLYSGSLTVAFNETVYAVSGGTGITDSAVASAAYVITAAHITTKIQ